jgi:2,3-bisphosphoglycerate-independent phosphoglycerate mutase
MKHVIIPGDSMADWPGEELNGRTPLEAAHQPNPDPSASVGKLGTVATMPPMACPQLETSAR